MTRTITLSKKWELAIWVSVALFVAVLAVFLALWNPGEGSYKSPWAVPIVTLSFLFILYVVLTIVMRRKLVVEMRDTGASPASLDKRGTVDAPSTPPPLRVEVSTSEQILDASLREHPVAARGRRLFDHSVAIHRGQVYRLVVTSVFIAFIGLCLQQPFPLSGALVTSLIGAPLMLRFMGMLRRWTSRLTIQYFAWFVLHGAWMVVICFVAASYIVTALAGALRVGASWGTIALAMLSTLALLFYVRRASVAQQKLRREVLAEPPIRLLFLWVFGDGERLASLLSGVSAVWHCLGPLQFLQGGGMIGMGGDLFRYFRGRTRLVADSDQEVDARIAVFQWAPHPWWGLYATNTLLCGDRSWRHALERLIDTDVVLMDLCGFSSVNAGCVYEIGQIVNRIATSRFVLLVDASTDTDALRATLESAWARMDPSSPNHHPNCDAIRLFHCDQELDQDGNPIAGHLKRNSDCILDLLSSGISLGNCGVGPAQLIDFTTEDSIKGVA